MLTIKRGDTGFGLKATLSNTNDCLDLTDCNVLFLMGDHEIPAEIYEAKEGKVMVFFEKTHTEKVGRFWAEFEVQFPDGRVETFPSDDYLTVRIRSDLGGVSP